MSYGRAVVVGSGFAGLVSARVLSDHFHSVVMLDRDRIPAKPEIRAGVPQANHQHHLLPGGLDVLCRLFPTLNTDLDRLGGNVAGPGDWFAYTPHGRTYRLSRFQPTPMADSAPLRMQSRALLEHVLRGHVETTANVTWRYNEHVRHCVHHAGRVTGVVTDDGTIDAELVIDATGRVSRTLGWLSQMGYEPPQVSSVECDFAYSSVFFRPDNPDAFEETGFLISSAHTGEFVKRGGSLVKIEDGQWLVTLAGRLGDHPPTELAALHRYIGTLHHPRMAELLEGAEPVAAPHQSLFPRSLNRHYEKLTRFPEGLLPIGDAICHINPGYAQGMSSVCRQADVLAQLLQARRHEDAPLEGLWQTFFQGVYEQTRAPWLFAAMNDFSKEGTTGDFPHHEAQAMAALKRFSGLADGGDLAAAELVDQIFDMQLPLSALG